MVIYKMALLLGTEYNITTLHQNYNYSIQIHNGSLRVTGRDTTVRKFSHWLKNL